MEEITQLKRELYTEIGDIYRELEPIHPDRTNTNTCSKKATLYYEKALETETSNEKKVDILKKLCLLQIPYSKKISYYTTLLDLDKSRETLLELSKFYIENNAVKKAVMLYENNISSVNDLYYSDLVNQIVNEYRPLDLYASIKKMITLLTNAFNDGRMNELRGLYLIYCHPRMHNEYKYTDEEYREYMKMYNIVKEKEPRIITIYNIESLERPKVKKELTKVFGSLDDNCTVCYEKFIGVGSTGSVKILVCGHILHDKCYVSAGSICPMCRDGSDDDDEDDEHDYSGMPPLVPVNAMLLSSGLRGDIVQNQNQNQLTDNSEPIEWTNLIQRIEDLRHR